MRFEKIHAHAFGALDDENLEFAPGLNVVWGVNEAGKSTWHDALYAGLCGIRRGRGRAKAEDEFFATRRRPWDREAWKVGARVALADGRVIDLHHDLDGRVDCKATDVQMGRDVSDEIIEEGTPSGARWLGLDRRSFLGTACVRQADLLDVQSEKTVDHLREYLQQAAASVGRDETAAAALDRIDAFRREQVGTTRTNSTKPLRRALDAEIEAREQLETTQAEHKEFLALAVEAGDAARAADRAALDVRVVRLALAQREAARRRQDVDRARELVVRHPEAPPNEDPEADRAAAIAAVMRAWDSRPDAIPELTGTAAAALRAQLEALPEMPDGDRQPHAEVVTACENLDDTRRLLTLHESSVPPQPVFPDTGNATEDDLRALAGEIAETTARPEEQQPIEQVRKLEGIVAGERRRQRDLLAGSGVTLVAAVLAVAVLGVNTGGISAGAVLVAITLSLGAIAWLRLGRISEAENRLRRIEGDASFARRREERRAAALQRAGELGLPDDPAKLRELADAWRDAQDGKLRLSAWRKKSEELAAALSAADETLREAVHARGVQVDDDATAGWEAYVAACRARDEQARAGERRPQLEQQLRDRESAEQAADDARDKRYAARHALRETAALCDIEAEDEDDETRADGLRHWLETREASRRRLETARVEWSELQHLLDGRPLADLESRLAEADRETTELCEGITDETPALPDGVDPDEELAAREERARSLADDSLRMDTLVEERRRSLPSVPESEERLAEAGYELDRVQRLDRILELTRGFLQAAQERVHRDIAPRLAATLAEWLPRVTNGRYNEANVDPETLEVRVRRADGPWRPAMGLSHGTAEMIYLLLRTSLARHLTRPGETCPLLLDDVTVQCDAERTRRLLDLLHAVSAEQQVILFSQEEEVLRWAENRLDGAEQDRLIRLTPPTVEVSARDDEPTGSDSPADPEPSPRSLF